jgi:hypothetical protein
MSSMTTIDFDKMSTKEATAAAAAAAAAAAVGNGRAFSNAKLKVYADDAGQ